MKPNVVTSLLAALVALCTTSCGNPEQKIRLQVSDELGRPVRDASCKACWWKDVFAYGTTDAKGFVEFTGRTGLTETHVMADAPGYYPARCYKFLMGFTPKKVGNRWEPWPVELTFVMKKIVRPHPMYFWTNEGGQDSQIFFPANDFKEPHGYDLIERDWVAPNGHGKVVDFLISGYHETPGDT